MRYDVDPTASTVCRASHSSRIRQTIRLLAIALVIVALVSVTIGSVVASAGTDASSVAGPELVVSDATVDADATETHRVTLTELPDGLAGFELTLALESDVGTISTASYPDHFEMTTDPVVNTDGQTITVEAVDLGDEITPGATDVTLATIDVTGVSPGETELRVVDSQIDADGGSRIAPSFEAGTLTVVDDSIESVSQSDADGSERERESGDSDSESDDSDSVPGFAVGTAIVAIAVVLLARRS